VTHRVRARLPKGELRRPSTLTAPDDLAAYLYDAAKGPGGHTPLVALPRSEGEVAQVLREARALLPVGAQSGLTGGARPEGEWVLSTSRLNALGPIREDRVRLQAGVALLSLEAELRPRRLLYPPIPTFTGAFVGGAASTNAAGAATFKYGSTREWISALTIVLASGDVLDLERGQVRASLEGFFEVVLADGTVRRVPVPTYAMPRVAKRSAGYFAEPGMDLVDLFVGSEGTLGIITEVEVRLIAEPVRLLAWLTFPTEARALKTVAGIRAASRATWAARDPLGIDVAAIESLDRRCLELLRSDGKDRELRVSIPPDAATAILLQAELAPGTEASEVLERIAAVEGGSERDGPLVRLLLLLREAGALDSLELALPGDSRRAAQFAAIREAVPMAVNDRVAALQLSDPKVEKIAADMIVPFEHLGEMMERYRAGFGRRGLDHALWGHMSDGNIHANVIPRSSADVLPGSEAILEFGADVIHFGGCPLSEHGVGRSRVKQALLHRLYGERGIAEMRRVKAALDPEGKLAPGVVFPATVP